jgi:hypothetical protein
MSEKAWDKEQNTGPVLRVEKAEFQNLEYQEIGRAMESVFIPVHSNINI